MTAWAARSLVHGNWATAGAAHLAAGPRMRRATLGTKCTMTYTSTTETFHDEPDDLSG
jgi:hypothetical protein